MICMERKSDITKMVRSFIQQEKETVPNPFLATRVMAAIEARKRKPLFWSRFVFKPALAMASLVMVIWLGILAGSSWVTGTREGAVLKNDFHTENLGFYSQLDKE